MNTSWYSDSDQVIAMNSSWYSDSDQVIVMNSSWYNDSDQMIAINSKCNIILHCGLYRNRDAPGLDTVIPLESTTAYNMMDVITGVSVFNIAVLMSDRNNRGLVFNIYFIIQVVFKVQKENTAIIQKLQIEKCGT